MLCGLICDSDTDGTLLPPICYLFGRTTCLALCTESISNTIHSLFPQNLPAHVCTCCHQPYLRATKTSDLWLERLATGELDGTERADLLRLASINTS